MTARSRKMIDRPADQYKNLSPERRAKDNRRASKWMKDNPEKAMHVRSKNRAKTLGLPFNIEYSDIVIPEYCPVLGIKIERGIGRSNHSDNSPSLDRIIPSLGYVKGNVIVISNRANKIKHNATPEEILKVAEFFSIVIKERNLSV